ncbi:hypothetical protein ONZ45_g6647 [Pleurotus djamor]|nr:hypothetical protein ONZ45_g6647 [Pleurotus djamor]
MAKSMRSKVKRSYRHKKREEGIYAATEAARLERLNAKLQSVITTPKVDLVDAEEDDDEDETMRGWYWFTAFGLVDPEEITPERLESLRRIDRTRAGLSRKDFD